MGLRLSPDDEIDLTLAMSAYSKQLIILKGEKIQSGTVSQYKWNS